MQKGEIVGLMCIIIIVLCAVMFRVGYIAGFQDNQQRAVKAGCAKWSNAEDGSSKFEWVPPVLPKIDNTVADNTKVK